MKHARIDAQALRPASRRTRLVALAAATAAMGVLAFVSPSHAQNYDVYGGRGADTQTLHHCGWVPTQRMDYAKANSRNTLIIQRKLSELGYYRGAIDGVNGPITKSAIRKFQAENGHQLVDGIVGIETSAGIGFNTHPSSWVRGCRQPYNNEVITRYYPRW